MEKHFKNKLKNHKVDWDKEQLLGSMKKELSQNKSGFNWKLLLLLLLPILFIATCWGLNDSDFSFVKNTNVSNNKNANATISKTSNNKSNTFDPNQSDIETKTVTPTITNSQLKNKLAKISPSSLSKNEHNKFESFNDSPSFQSTLNTNSRLQENNYTISSIKNESTSKSGGKQNTSTSQLTYDSSISSITETNGDKNALVNIAGREKIESLKSLPIKLTAIQLEEWHQEDSLNSIMDSLTSQIKTSFDTPKFKKSFFASSSVDAGLVHRNMSFRSNNLDFVERLKKNERTVTSLAFLSANLMVGYQHQSGWMIQSGLEYQEVNEFFKYNKVESENILSGFNERAFYFLNQQSDTLFFSDTASIIKTEERIVRHWNKHSYFNIPIEIGCRRVIRRANIFGTVGVSYAFVHNFKGRVNQLNEDDSNEIIDNPNFNFKNRIGVQLSVGADYPLFKQTHIFAKMAYRRSPKLVGKWNEQFYQSYSFGLGVRVLIGRDK